MIKKLLQWTIIITALFVGCATPEPETVTVTRIVEVSAEPPPSYTVDLYDTTQVVETLHATQLDQTFRIYTVLPHSYATDSSKSYPVLYVADGNYDAALANLIMQTLRIQRAVPEVIIVGIGYDTNEDAALLEMRLRDLMPSDLEGEGAAGLLAFLTDELIPHIDSHYRTVPEKRTLAGFSAGGTFALYTLFNAPELFEGIVATSPTIQTAQWSAFRALEAYSAENSDLPVNLYISVGGDEGGFAILDGFVANLNTQEFENFRVKTDVLAGENHLTMWMAGIQRGLREIYIARGW